MDPVFKPLKMLIVYFCTILEIGKNLKGKTLKTYINVMSVNQSLKLRRKVYNIRSDHSIMETLIIGAIVSILKILSMMRVEI